MIGTVELPLWVIPAVAWAGVVLWAYGPEIPKAIRAWFRDQPKRHRGW